MQNPIKMDDLGVSRISPFQETSMWLNIWLENIDHSVFWCILFDVYNYWWRWDMEWWADCSAKIPWQIRTSRASTSVSLSQEVPSDVSLPAVHVIIGGKGRRVLSQSICHVAFFLKLNPLLRSMDLVEMIDLRIQQDPTWSNHQISSWLVLSKNTCILDYISES